MDVDLVLLSRDLGPLRDDVRRAIDAQVGVRPIVHRVAGEARPGDANRWETIARARNEAKRLGTTPWFMFLDDDIVLGPDCVATLLRSLQRRPSFAALGADYDGEMASGVRPWEFPGHVGMGAVLFRRARLDRVVFRWEEDRCECSCCVQDLREAGHSIGYHPGAVAWHRKHPPSTASTTGQATSSTAPAVADRPPEAGRVLAAFDHRHSLKFQRLFLGSLREAGNPEAVTVVGYDLRPGQSQALAALPGVEVVERASRGESPAARRLEDFQDVIAGWPDETPVAYWDAGDVLFQGRLEPLWEIARANPELLLVAREPIDFKADSTNHDWVETIHDRAARDRFLALLSSRPILNSGFAAGTAKALRGYLRDAARLRGSDLLRGSVDWGDQTALNVFCHTQPGRWLEVPEGWNFCLYGRSIRQGLGPKIESLDRTPVHVVHGNGGSLGPRTFLLLHRP